MIEIVFLAMLAGFIALRLVSVLGRRTGEEKPVRDGFPGEPPAAPPALEKRNPSRGFGGEWPVAVREPLNAITQADRNFDADAFLNNAQAAYRHILEAFWRGDRAELKPYVADDVLAQFEQVLDARAADGLTVENSLIAIDRAEYVSAALDGAMAEIAVRFDARITALTKNAAGAVIEGTPGETVETHDVWTFSRNTHAADPVWLLTATDSED